MPPGLSMPRMRSLAAPRETGASASPLNAAVLGVSTPIGQYFTKSIEKMLYTDGMPATDVHQHLWPEPLLRLLAARPRAPRLRRARDGWELELAGEAPARFDLAPTTPRGARRSPRDDGLERVLVAPSSPLGIEALPALRPSRCSTPSTRACSSSARRSRRGARSRSPRPSRPRSTRCSTPAPPGCACPAPRSAGPQAARPHRAGARAARRPRRAAVRAPGPAPPATRGAGVVAAR